MHLYTGFLSQFSCYFDTLSFENQTRLQNVTNFTISKHISLHHAKFKIDIWNLSNTSTYDIAIKNLKFEQDC